VAPAAPIEPADANVERTVPIVADVPVKAVA